MTQAVSIRDIFHCIRCFAQISELYSMLLADREKLNRRFQELSIKSSLSEYVVNSRALLDVATVHRATEAILRNETPQQAKADKTSEYKNVSLCESFIPPYTLFKRTLHYSLQSLWTTPSSWPTSARRASRAPWFHPPCRTRGTPSRVATTTPEVSRTRHPPRAMTCTPRNRRPRP